jgi:phage terminase large subunit-like protein
VTLADFFELTLDERALLLAQLSEAQKIGIAYEWLFWARGDQRLPDGDWIYWLILAGRGAGKTRAGAEAVRTWVQDFPIVNLIGSTHDDVRDVMVQGDSGLLKTCPRHERPIYRRSRGRLDWPNGAVSLLFSAEEPDRLRGKQHMKLWCDELAAWREPEAFEQALLGLRLGVKPQAVITTTPRPSRIIKQLSQDRDAVVMRATTFANTFALAPGFVQRITARYEGRAIGRQELFAEILEQTPGALWNRELLQRQRVALDMAPEDYAEIVVAVDPPAKSGERADECGIVVAAKHAAGHVYALADLTSQGETPGQWSARVVSAFRRYKANRVVAEANNGGDMVKDVLRRDEANLPVKLVHATRGKFLRAEPVAAAYERGLVHHVGVFEKLEAQLCALTSDFDRATSGSPDRADALVWAVSDLLGLHRADTDGMLAYYASRAKSA